MVKSQEDTTTEDDTTTADDTTLPTTEDDTTTADDTTIPSGDTTTGSPSDCECIGTNTEINDCKQPNGFKKCNVHSDQTCPDMFCDKLGRCFSVLACPAVEIPDEMPCEDCTCMDPEDDLCRDDPLGQCHLCDNASPRKICRVHADSKCADKYCIDDQRCYAVSACGCDKNKPTTTK